MKYEIQYFKAGGKHYSSEAGELPRSVDPFKWMRETRLAVLAGSAPGLRPGAMFHAVIRLDHGDGAVDTRLVVNARAE